MADLFQSALAKLQKLPADGKTSIYEHLTNICQRLLEERPEKIDLIDLSTLHSRKVLPQVESDPLVPFRSIPEDASRTQSRLQSFGDREPSIDPATGAPVKTHTPNAYESEDTVRASQLFEAVGIALSEQEMYEVALQLKKLGEDPKLKLKSIRFFGKFFGIYADYYVFETAPAVTPSYTPETAEEKATREAAREYPSEQGTGANVFQYYVCTELGGKATKLDDVKPEQVRAARTLKRFLTGRLNSPVSTFPTFPGNEAAFLRAQIARIAASTVLSPLDWFTIEEDDDGKQVINKAEEINPVGAPDAGAMDEWLGNWVHRYYHLKAQGRCETKPIREIPEDSEEEEVELTPEETEEPPAGGNVLAPVTDDAKVYGGNAWTPVFSSSSRFTKGQVSGLRSNLWPGAAAVTHGTDFFNVYVGWGLKNAPYVPLPPPPITEEFPQDQMVSIDMPQKPDPSAAPPAAPAEE